MPSWASRNGSLETEDSEAIAPCVSRSCMGLAPGAKGTPALRPSGVNGLVAVHDVGGNGENRGGGTELRYVSFMRMYSMNWCATSWARTSTRSSSLPYLGKSPSISKSTITPCSSRIGWTFAYLMADGSRPRRRGRRSGGEPAVHVLVVQSHLDALVAVLVMHVVDDVERVDIHAGKPLDHVLVLGHHVVEVQGVALDRAELRADLLLGDLVHAAVERVEEALGQVGAGAKELHLLAHAHGGHAAGDGVVVTVVHAHDVVVLVLDGRGGDGGLGAELLEGRGQLGGPRDGEVGLRAGAVLSRACAGSGSSSW